MMRRQRPLPDWVNDLLHEFTRPPYYLTDMSNVPSDAVQPQAAAPKSDATDAHPNCSDRAEVSRSENHKAAPLWQAKVEHSANPNGRRGKPKDIVTAALEDSATSPENTPVSTNWQMVFRKAGYPPSAAKSYGWSIKNAQITQSIVRVHTAKGSYAFKRTHLNSSQIRFLHAAFEFVKQQGFTRLAPFVLTSHKQPYVVDKERVYYATPWRQGQHANFSSVAQVGHVAELLATFHEQSRGFETDAYAAPMEFNLERMLRQRSEDLRTLLAIAQTRREPDDFDHLLAKMSTELREDADESVRLIRNDHCQSFLTEDENLPGLCHLDVIPENFIFTPQHEMTALDFDLCTYAPRALDLAHLLRRALQRQQWQTAVAYTCFSSYDSVRPMVGPEYTLVQALMTFPYRAWRVANAHYRFGAAPAQLDELDECHTEGGRRTAFLSSLARQIRS